MRSLECRVPPVLLFGVVALGMILGSGGGEGWPVAALLLVLLGCVPGFGALLRFRRHGTSVSPMRPERASVLVTSGIYGLSRNPMYLGLLCWMMALACYLGGVWVWIGPLVLWGWLTRFQIVPEERALRARFGEPYLDYCRRVRRWC